MDWHRAGTAQTHIDCGYGWGGWGWCWRWRCTPRNLSEQQARLVLTAPEMQLKERSVQPTGGTFGRRDGCVPTSPPPQPPPKERLNRAPCSTKTRAGIPSRNSSSTRRAAEFPPFPPPPTFTASPPSPLRAPNRKRLRAPRARPQPRTHRTAGAALLPSFLLPRWGAGTGGDGAAGPNRGREWVRGGEVLEAERYRRRCWKRCRCGVGIGSGAENEAVPELREQERFWRRF